MKKTICAAVLCLALAGCANRTANPTPEYTYGDDKKSCRALQMEMSQIKADIEAKVGDSNGTTMRNVACGVTGVFLIVPFFFMDVGGADKTELDALRRRYNALGRIAVDKDCQEIEIKEIKFDTPVAQQAVDGN